MGFNVDEQWLKAYEARTGLNVSGDIPKAEKRTKYGNVKEDGFDSRHEKKCYEDLRIRCLDGEFIGIARQVAFYLPSGIKYIADFVTFDGDGGFTVYDAKSDATRKDKTYRMKKRMMAKCLGIEITEI